MKFDERKVKENRFDRGQIIRTCALFHPKPITVERLRLAIEDSMFRSSELDVHLHFLESGNPNDERQPQYICRPAGGELGIYHDGDKIHLTRFGYQLVEGTREDENITM